MINTPEKKISTLNDEIDVKLFVYIARKSILFPIIFLVIALLGSWLYLRYTPAVYQTSSTLQLGGESQTRQILPMANIYEDNLSKQLELIRSSVFLTRALSRLPLQVSYFSKGRVLNFELYRSAPFSVEANVKDNSIYGRHIIIDFIDEQNARLSVLHNGQARTREIKLNTLNSFPDMDIKVYLNQSDSRKIDIQSLSHNDFFFVINNPVTLVRNYSEKLRVNILNASARTIQISFQGNNANKAADIVNAISEEFSIYDLEKKAESANNILGFIDKQLDLLFDKLTESEIDLERFRKQHGIEEKGINPLPTIQSRLSDFEERIVGLQIEHSILSELEQNLSNLDQFDIYKLIAILSGSEFHGNISRLLISLQDLLLEREKMLYEVTPESRQIESINFQIDIQKRMIIESITSMRSNLDSRMEEINSKISRYESIILDHQEGNYSILEYSMLQRVHSINERFYNQLVEKKAEYSISKAGFVSESVILERAAPPSHPISPRPRLIYAAGALGSLFLGFLIIILRYLFYNEITSLHDAQKHTQVPIIGLIPKYKSDIPQSQLLVLKKPKSLIAEALRAIRTNLMFVDNSKGSKLIAVTSTISGEGKTFFAINLAGILAFSNKKVIVLDFDMRKPKIHVGFGVQNLKGMSTILSEMDQVDDCINPSKIQNLDFITAGPIPPNPSELIISDKMNEVVAYLKEKYDYVIIDNPPVGIVTDGMKSITMADYPIYIIKANYSKRIFIQNINRLHSDNKITKLSVVLNAVDKNYSSYGYDKGYSYGYYYGGYGYGYYDDHTKPSLWLRFARLLGIKK